MRWIARHPFLSAALTLILVLGMAPGMMKLKIDASSDGLLTRGDPDVAFYHETKELFGDDVNLSIIVSAKDVFQKSILETVERLSLEGEVLDGVSRVVSLSTVSNLKGRDGVLNTDPLLSYIPDDPDELATVREDALTNDNLVGEVINAEGTTTAIHYSIESRPDDVGFDDRLVKAVDNLIQQELARYSGEVDIYQIGAPYLKTQIVEYIKRDWRVLGPASTLVILLSLLFFFRSLVAIIVPCVTGIISVLVTFGFMGYCGFTINPVTIIIPTLLLVVGCTEDIHLIAEYAWGLGNKEKKYEAIRNMAVKSGTAIFLTSLTTFVGFITIAPNSIPMLSEFGISASFGMVLNFVITILVVPTIFTWFPAPKAFKKVEKESMVGVRKLIMSAVLKHKKLSVAATFILCAVSVFGCFKIVIDTNYVSFFKEDSEIRQLFRKASRDLVGGNNFFVVIDSGYENGVKDPRTLQQIEKLTDYIASKYDKAIGYASFVRKLRMELNDGDLNFRSIPDSGEEISQYTLMLNPDDLTRFVDFDMQKACVLVRCRVAGSGPTNAMVADIEDWVKRNMSPKLDVKLTGEPLLVAKASDVISRELIKNLVYVFAAIFVIISILFVSLKAGLLAMVPNVFPVLVNFGFMGIFSIPLSTATFPVAIVALGIAVDDTIHLMVRYSKELKTTSDNLEAIETTIRKELRPVFTTSVALILGFCVLLLAEFGSAQQFGLLAAVAILSAFVSDLLVTPILLQATPLINAWDFLKLKISDKLIGRCQLFQQLSKNEVKKLLLLGEMKSYLKGENVITQGQSADNLIVILDGELSLSRSQETSSVDLGKIEAGGLIGEMAFFNKTERTANAVALTDVEVLVIDGKRLERVQKRNPDIAAKVYYNLSKILTGRLDKTTLELLQSQTRKPF
ncbi:MAG: MMPL family transporter [Opitutaceae bacterium]